MTPRNWRSGLVGLLAFVAGCSQLLDIGDARVDETLTPRTNAGTAGKSPDGGTLATAGNTGVDTGGRAGGTVVNTAGDEAGGAPSGPHEGSAGAAPESSPCERYCDEISTNCKGKYEQYRTFDQCVQVCKRLPVGAPGDEDVNSVSCRIRQAEFAASEPFVYCKSAGPLGAGRCGSNCISYCALMQETCTPASTAGNLEPSYFGSSQDCIAACNALPSEGGPVQYSSSANVEPSSFVGNTVYCRTYHLAAGLEQDAPDEHCPHAMGGDPCVEQ